MNSKNYICGSNKFVYSKGYIGLPIVVNDLPETVEVNGVTLHRKTSFHISLVCVKDVLVKKSDAEQIVLDEFCTFVSKNDINFIKYASEFRFAEHEERKTLITLCEVSHLNSFLELLSSKLGIEVPLQPTHVTLFTLQPDMGIGLNSPADMESKSVKVEAPHGVNEFLNI